MITPVGISVADYVNASLTGARSHMRISIPGGSVALEDDDIEQGGISISSLLNSSTNLKIGEAISQQISIPLLNTDALTGIIWTAEFKVEYGIEVNGDTYWITLGYFTGVKPNLYVGDQVVNFTAFDRMQKFERIADDWLDSLTYPMTVLQMLKSLCDFCGVGWRAGDELPNIKNRSYSTAPVVQRGLTCREILAAIAEACGCYAKIDNEGYCKLIWFANHTSDYSLTGDEEFSVRIFKNSIGKTWEGLEDYRWIDLEGLTWSDLEGMRNQFRIDGIRVTITEDDVGVLYPDGMVGNIYQIVDNPFLMTSNDSDVVNYIVPIYTRLNNIGGYIPVNVTSIGCALIEAGDIVNIEADGEVVSMPIFSKNATWNGALMDMIETTGDATTEEVPRDVSEKLYEGGRYHKWKNTVDELYSELYDPTTGDVSILKQTASELGLSAEGIDIQGGKYVKISSGGAFIVDAQNFKVDSDSKIFEVGDWKYNEDGIISDNASNGKFEIIRNGESLDLKYTSTDNKTVTVKIMNSDSPRSIVTVDDIYSMIYCTMLGDTSHKILESTIETGYFDYIFGTLVNNSSKDVKHDIKPLEDVGEIIDKLNPVSFVYDNDPNETKRKGLIYEEAIEVLPEICVQNYNDKAIMYMELIPMLLKEIQCLRKRVKELEERGDN